MTSTMPGLPAFCAGSFVLQEAGLDAQAQRPAYLAAAKALRV